MRRYDYRVPLGTVFTCFLFMFLTNSLFVKNAIIGLQKQALAKA